MRIGKLGREEVCTFEPPGVEALSDCDDVDCIDPDDVDARKIDVVRTTVREDLPELIARLDPAVSSEPRGPPEAE